MANDVVYMNKDAWTGILDQIRESSGNMDKMTASQAKQAIAGLSSGGLTEITDASYLFYKGARLEGYKDLTGLLGPITTSEGMFLEAEPSKMGPESDDVLAGVDFSKCETAEHMFEDIYSPENLSNTILSAATRAYPSLLFCSFMFNNAEAAFSKVSMDLPKCQDVNHMFAGCKFEECDFDGFNAPTLIESNSMFVNATGTVTFPENFLPACGSIDNMFATSELSVGTTQYVIKFPKGFAAHPRSYRFDPKGVIYLSTEQAFDSCEQLRSVDFNSDFFSDVKTYEGATPASDKKIVVETNDMFIYASSLKCVIFRMSLFIPHPGGDFFSDTISGQVLAFVPRALVDTYKAATNWSAMSSRIFAVEDYTKDGTIDGDFDYDKAGISLT